MWQPASGAVESFLCCDEAYCLRLDLVTPPGDGLLPPPPQVRRDIRRADCSDGVCLFVLRWVTSLPANRWRLWHANNRPAHLDSG